MPRYFSATRSSFRSDSPGAYQARRTRSSSISMQASARRAASRFAMPGVLEDRRELSGELPGGEKERPIDVLRDLADGYVVEDAQSRELRLLDLRRAELQARPLLVGDGVRRERFGALVRVQTAQLLVIFALLRDECVLLVWIEERGDRGDR